MFQRLKAVGPGAIVAAAFIGPGTLTVASKSGGTYGYTLLWAVAFSTFACVVLQEMSARLGVVGQLGVGEAIRKQFNVPLVKAIAIGLVLSAVLVGNAAYESGNLAGGVLGITLAAQTSDLGVFKTVIVLSVAVVAFALLWTAKYIIIERSLIVLVASMGFVFLSAALLSRPDFSAILRGFFTPSIPKDGWLIVLALIGTTVVPYNLFLHASAVKRRWKTASDLQTARLDTALSVIGGGLITAAILIIATPFFELRQSAVATAPPKVELMAIFQASSGQLGSWFPWFIAIGFCIAGLSSAITAPLAAAFATAELFDWPKELSDWRFRAVWILVLCVGVMFALFVQRPQELILFAQAANGLLLPIIAIFLIWISNSPAILGKHRNSLWSNVLGIIVVLVTARLGLVGIMKALKEFI